MMKQATMDGAMVETANCEWCGRVFKRKATGRIAVFCSTACRMKAYRNRKRKAVFEARRPVLKSMSDVLTDVDELLAMDYETGFTSL